MAPHSACKIQQYYLMQKIYYNFAIFWVFLPILFCKTTPIHLTLLDVLALIQKKQQKSIVRFVKLQRLKCINSVLYKSRLVYEGIAQKYFEHYKGKQLKVSCLSVRMVEPSHVLTGQTWDSSLTSLDKSEINFVQSLFP